MEAALKSVGEILSTMTGKVQDRGRLEVLEHAIRGRHLESLGGRDVLSNDGGLLDSFRKRSALARLLYSHDQRLRLGGSAYGPEWLLSMEKRPDGRGVRRHKVVGTAHLVVAGIDAGCMEGQAHEDACRAEGQSATLSPFGTLWVG
jgi:hypothetical protein